MYLSYKKFSLFKSLIEIKLVFNEVAESTVQETWSEKQDSPSRFMT